MQGSRFMEKVEIVLLDEDLYCKYHIHCSVLFLSCFHNEVRHQQRFEFLHMASVKLYLETTSSFISNSF